MPRVLLIESEIILAMNLGVLLRREGYDVIAMVTNGSQALHLLAQQTVDLIICDIRIQGPISGLDTIRQLPRPCPVIFTAAFSDATLPTEADQLHPLVYLEKPVSHHRLRNALRQAFGTTAPLVSPKYPADWRSDQTDPEGVRAALWESIILTEAHWEQFKLLFERVYPNYLLRLRTTYPELTPAEVRLICLSRLSLSTREMAHRLGVSTDTVFKTRYRIRKKADLPDGIDLNEVFAAI